MQDVYVSLNDQEKSFKPSFQDRRAACDAGIESTAKSCPVPHFEPFRTLLCLYSWPVGIL